MIEGGGNERRVSLMQLDCKTGGRDGGICKMRKGEIVCESGAKGDGIEIDRVDVACSNNYIKGW
jgi:hypothetical protein